MDGGRSILRRKVIETPDAPGTRGNGDVIKWRRDEGAGKRQKGEGGSSGIPGCAGCDEERDTLARVTESQIHAQLLHGLLHRYDIIMRDSFAARILGLVS